jgi:hypothetical protein
VEYKIFEAITMHDLEALVNAQIKEGWVPHGGLVLRSTEDFIYYYQAMSRKIDLAQHTATPYLGGD